MLLRLREIAEPSVSAAMRSSEAEHEQPAEGQDEEDEPSVSDEEGDALVAAVEIPSEFSRHSAVVDLNRLKRQITDLGPVNLAAEEDYEAALERQGFLRMQHDDLVNAEQTLRRTIGEIDESTRETFLQTFQQVEQHFRVMFHRLFGGGVTRLELTEPDNVLETGIEIIVQPPGKKLQNLALLSGGERALTAVALLFAFLKVKPSPFVVLDEVDAPLDEANVGRFASLLREFSANSQFIVITHNRGTMEAAHALYGVTMQEPGISRLLSLRLEDKHQTREMAPTYEPVRA
jgi:chromosome segregation protein